jgi:putative hydrolase of the HAD superfamily
MLISHLIFDLDNTLYSSTAEMDTGITFRMISCVAEFFDISYTEAVALRAQKLPGFSTTLEWLRHEGFSDTERYFSRVHPENEAEELPADPDLRPLLESITIPKSILTNSPREHADRVLKKLNVSDLFTNVCDIRDCHLNGKPYPEAYRKSLELCGGTINDTLFFDDQYKYTDGYEVLGGTAVIVGTENGAHLNSTLPSSLLPRMDQPPHLGRTLSMPSIYGLPSLLKQTADL